MEQQSKREYWAAILEQQRQSNLGIKRLRNSRADRRSS